MPEGKTNKERVNITVDPHIHRAFASTADRQGQTVSGILNTMMGIYLEEADSLSQNNPVANHLRSVLGGDAADYDLRRAAFRVATEAGFKSAEKEPIKTDYLMPGSTRLSDEWVGETGKKRVGIKVVTSISHQPDLVLGQALMLKARHHCDTVLITLPFTTGIDPGIENTLQHAGLAMVSIDNLEAAIGKGSRSAAKREENKKRLSQAQSELEEMQNKRKSRSASETAASQEKKKV
jgi:hypothetical protein